MASLPFVREEVTCIFGLTTSETARYYGLLTENQVKEITNPSLKTTPPNVNKEGIHNGFYTAQVPK